jgi:hypothetical protein
MKKSLSAILILAVLAACQQTIPKEALILSPESLEFRQLQTRVFETEDEEAILAASAAVIQDLGFQIDEAETDLGLIVGSKDRDAVEAGQVAGAIMVALIFGVAVPIDKEQKIRLSIVTRPHNDEETEHAVRVTFQRLVWNDRGQISRVEKLDDPELYQEFFSNLSKSVFLEAQGI